MRTGTADLPLHSGRTPRWLFNRMVKLAGCIVEVCLEEHGSAELLRRISDPFWFQAFSCVLGFDWHSSGTTTTTCGALKQALDPEEHGIAVAGGKGRASRKALEEIEAASQLFSFSEAKMNELRRASRLSAKVDSSCIQDGYQLYHHSFFLTEKGTWAVVQQGMGGRYARRYHWLSQALKDLVSEPHTGICSDERHSDVLNMVARDSREAREVSVDLVKDNPSHLRRYFKPSGQLTLDEPKAALAMPSRHELLAFDLSERSWTALKRAYEIQPESYEELLSIRGIGAKSIRALALISELVYGAQASWSDPAKYSFAHGGKDGFPYPVDRACYDRSIEFLRSAVQEARLNRDEKRRALRRLHQLL